MAEADVLDTYRRVETPEGVELGIRVAGPIPRAMAWLVDLLIRIVIYVVASIALAFLGAAGGGMFLLLLFLGEWFYPVLFEVLRRGATPGKEAFGLVVLHDDGTPVGWSASIVRNLLLFADFMPFMYGFGLLSMLFSGSFKRFGDIAGGTVVAYRERETRKRKLPEVPPLAPNMPLSTEEQMALIAYAERFDSWTPARAAELSDLLRGLTGASGEEGSKRALGMAAWLLGNR
ncbi:MAG: RDD family protein [Planctomycetota bacterium]